MQIRESLIDKSGFELEASKAIRASGNLVDLSKSQFKLVIAKLIIIAVEPSRNTETSKTLSAYCNCPQNVFYSGVQISGPALQTFMNLLRFEVE